MLGFCRRGQRWLRLSDFDLSVLGISPEIYETGVSRRLKPHSFLALTVTLKPCPFKKEGAYMTCIIALNSDQSAMDFFRARQLVYEGI
jgi:hypothetical protein